MKPIILFFCLIYTNLISMDIEIGLDFKHNGTALTFLEKYYDPESKILNLSNLNLDDHALEDLYKSIKRIVNLCQITHIIIERNNLKNIPYRLITFALINKNIRYLSLKHNQFNIPLIVSQEDTSPEVSIPINLIEQGSFKHISTDILDTLSRARSGSIPQTNVAGTIAQTIWYGISPEIEKVINKHNSKQSSKIFYKKIIIIDTNIPPITIIDHIESPKTKLEIAKEVSLKISFMLIGAAITLIPQIISWTATVNESS